MIAQHFGARTLGITKILRMVDDPARIGVGGIDSQRQRMNGG